jgi:phosphate transport system substrate-binding protein
VDPGRADTGCETTQREKETTLKRTLSIVTAGLVVALTAAVAAGAKSSATTLTGAGSTFVSPLVSLWSADYAAKTGVQIAYSPVGSGAGIAAITARQVDFGASDAPLSPDQVAACNGCVQIPWALSATSIIYNLSGVPNNLHLTGQVLARIYLGQIKKWNDPAIKGLNPKVALPSTDITPVYRSDNSGTTYNFTDYLSVVSPDWKSKIGRGVNANWPAGQGGRGSSGVAGVVANTQGAVGYVDVAFALKNQLKFMSMRNASGAFTTPGLRGINAAASTVKTVPASGEMHIVNPPKADRLAYPICTFTYVIVPAKSGKAADLRRFLFYAVSPTQGQKQGPKLLFAPLPKVVLVAAEKTLKKIQG